MPDQRSLPNPTPSPSPAAERAAFMRRRGLALAGIGLLIVVASALAYSALAAQRAPTPAPAQPAPTGIASATAPAQPAPTGIASATNPPAPTAAATAAPQAAIVAPPSGTACNPIAGVPIYTGAACTEQDRDHDDGIIKLKNTYVAIASADDVRRFYEGWFTPNGWALSEFKYDLSLAQRRVQIEVDTDHEGANIITKVRLTEHGAPAAAVGACAPIAGVPAFPNAACAKFESDKEDGVIQSKSTYTTSASPEQVWQFYANALAQGGWAGQKFQYAVQQGTSQLEFQIEAQPAPNTTTQFKIAQK
jgi:hypothetical protein